MKRRKINRENVLLGNLIVLQGAFKTMIQNTKNALASQEQVLDSLNKVILNEFDRRKPQGSQPSKGGE